mmetsp:Transcript_118160/g.294722  ORF Transcript_118160/g.294722 Transcript_118160/m.294722 type:complete len:224 (-) Transcript_118160:145-816(-)
MSGPWAWSCTACLSTASLLETRPTSEGGSPSIRSACGRSARTTSAPCSASPSPSGPAPRRWQLTCGSARRRRSRSPERTARTSAPPRRARPRAPPRRRRSPSVTSPPSPPSRARTPRPPTSARRPPAATIWTALSLRRSRRPPLMASMQPHRSPEEVGPSREIWPPDRPCQGQQRPGAVHNEACRRGPRNSARRRSRRRLRAFRVPPNRVARLFNTRFRSPRP